MLATAVAIAVALLGTSLLVPLMIDPATIADPALRAVITTMMNHIDALEERVRQQKEEIQRLRDENNRLRGEHRHQTSRASKSILGSIHI